MYECVVYRVGREGRTYLRGTQKGKLISVAKKFTGAINIVVTHDKDCTKNAEWSKMDGRWVAM